MQPTFLHAARPAIPKRGRLVALSALAGFVLTVIWSAPFVDRVIGDNVANSMLGHDAKATPLDGVLAGIAFAFVTGLAGSFTACNIAVFGVVTPLVGDRGAARPRWRDSLRALGWICVGAVGISAVYGALVAIVGTSMPQFATTASVAGVLSPRQVQSMIVFGVIGVAFIYLGLAALRLVPDPFARVRQRHPAVPLVVMGVLIGALLIGRPFPLFRIMFRHAAESGNVLYGMSAFVLQSLGNLVIAAVVFLVLAHATGGRVQRWLAARPGRTERITAVAFLVFGTFTLLYWDLRSLGRAGLIWYPAVGW
ncbi:hypothetical protein [Lentzea flaviverrucosa]|uniref:Cytochrome C biogenesis protein transmembrane region n=1 Tax=Lentzea flaviverrucosa TaxID=200379 RepID=A0A1H9HKM9_9PSEU|nr:hypothetical protein [Lentzea flaviverrucosa]RDI34557.1 hypothetical protein DFR72_101305 [Lentzea flaviverrucosa]SEQ62890.1 hypothetical protein SAMN05216195_102912 [Lentzea flaviverrucosa]